MNVTINYLPGFKNIVDDYLNRNFLRARFMETTRFCSYFNYDFAECKTMENLRKSWGENNVTTVFKKYLPFIFTEDNLLKINFKNKVLLIVPKSLRYEIISLSHCEWYTEAVPGGVL